MVGSNIFDTVVEAIKEPLPEFDTIEAEAISAPMRRARDLATLESMFNLSHRFILIPIWGAIAKAAGAQRSNPICAMM